MRIKLMFRYFTYIFLFSIALANSGVLKAETDINNFEGVWLGSMQIPDGPILRMGVEIFRKADGQWGGNIASLDQNHRYIPVSKVSFDGHWLTVQIDAAPVFIKVATSDSKEHLKGDFHEGAQAFPIELHRVDALPDITRPQTPGENVPYTIEEITYQNLEDDIWLSATLTRPEDAQVHPAVILIAGSGPAHRDAYHSGHRPFKLLADVLTRQGFVVLRADKRGVHKSTGDYKSATQKNFSHDIQAAIKFLKSHKQVDENKVNLLGHSEGSLIAAMAASNEQVNAIVSMAGPGMTVLDTILLQDQTEPAAKGATKSETDILLGFSQRFYNTVLSASNETQRKKNLQSLYDGLTGNEATVVNKWNNRSGTLNVDFAARNSFSDMLTGNPAKYWQTISIPVLVLNGSKDSQVPATENVSGIINALKKGNNKKFEKRIFPNLNHMFQAATTGATDEYSQIDETLNPSVIDAIGTWLQSNN
jgi:dipeptidyl aminopeptidase/acylaminoacyl peptidase